MNNQRKHFQQIVVPNPEEIKWRDLNPRYYHNTMILEIANNFKYVRWLLYLVKENKLKRIDSITQEWLEFIQINGIAEKLLNYSKDEDRKFIDEYFKTESS